MNYILDTNVVSALMKGDARCIARLQRIEKEAVQIPQPVLAEIAYGIERLAKSKKKELLRTRFDLIRMEIGRAAWTDAVSHSFGTIKAALEKKGTRIEDFDVAIAAHALATSSVLVTANLDHMIRVSGLRVEDWAASGSAID